MPNTTLLQSQQEDVSIEADIKSLISLLHKLKNKLNPHKYIIHEYYPINKSADYKGVVYELYNLEMGCEDGIVYSSDSQNDLYGKFYNTYLALRGFCEDGVVIGIKRDVIMLSFSDGYIKIYYWYKKTSAFICGCL